LRIYAVDSTRLLRTLRCLSEVSRMCLFDPVLAVLSSSSGRISFRDLYADGGSGLGQGGVTGFSADAFAAVEPPTPTPTATATARPGNDDHSGSNGSGSNSGSVGSGGGGVVLHCVDARGTVFEASTSGLAWNFERQNHDGGAGGGGARPSAGALGRGWHVCADLGASLLVRNFSRPWTCLWPAPPRG
ncbi:unnamed protein product, partial [Hapterophycus canaliculatus]